MKRTPLGRRCEVAEYLGVTETTMAQWAWRRQGPPFRKVGREARYSWADVDAWLAAQKAGGTGSPAA